MAILTLPTLAAAQIERNQLPPLPGASEPDPGLAPSPQGAYPPPPGSGSPQDQQQQAYPPPSGAGYPQREDDYPPLPGIAGPAEPLPGAAGPPEPLPWQQPGQAAAPPSPLDPPGQGLQGQDPLGQDSAPDGPLNITPQPPPAYGEQGPGADPQSSGVSPQFPAIQPQSPAFPSQSPAISAGDRGGGQASALPANIWQGVDLGALRQLIQQAPLPSASPALSSLIARALAVDQGGGQELAVKVGALERAGRMEELAQLLSQAAASNEPGASARYAIVLLALNRVEEACATTIGPAPPSANPNSDTTRATYLIPAYCAATKGDFGAAGLALQLARDSNVDVTLPTAIVARLDKSGGGDPVSAPKSVDIVDYVFLALDKDSVPADIASRAAPRLLFLLAQDPAAPAEARVVAAERAAALNIIDGATLARAYRDAAAKLAKSAQSPSALRAKLFAAVEGAAAAKFRAESIDALLASGKDAGIEVPLAQALAQANAGLAQDSQANMFAETGVRVAALSGDEQSAWAFVDAGGDRVKSWQLLLAARNPSDPRADAALQTGVDVAMAGRLPAPLLHRLVTVLDALNYNVPIPLWDAASKEPQPTDGYLPETGVLTALKEAADGGHTGRTILLSAAVLGPDGPGGANLIALGDAMRALKRAGLDAEARAIGFEALYAHWPARGKG